MKQVSLFLSLLFTSGILMNTYAGSNQQKFPLSKNETNHCRTMQMHGKHALQQTVDQNNTHDRSVIYKLIGERENYMNFVSHSWAPQDSNTYSYNFANNVASLLENDDYNYSSAWDTSSRYLYTYDVHGNQLSQIYQGWNEDSSRWDNSEKDAYSYDNAGHQLTDTNSAWSDTVWTNNNLSVYTYDGNGNTTSELDFFWSSGAWDTAYLYSYTYDGNNNATSELEQHWNSGSSTFQNSNEHLYAHDGNHNLVRDMFLEWNNTVWDTLSKSTAAYNGNNKITLEMDSTWSSGSGTWTPNEEFRFTYDVNSNEIKYEELEWGGSAYDSSYEADETYDGNNNRTYELDYTYNSDSSTIEPNYQYYYYYTSFTTTQPSAINEITNNLNASLFPNPSSGDMTVSFDLSENSNIRLNIYDAQGRIVSAENHSVNSGTNSVKLNYPQISAGNYFLQLIDHSTGKASVLQFVKE